MRDDEVGAGSGEVAARPADDWSRDHGLRRPTSAIRLGARAGTLELWVRDEAVATSAVAPAAESASYEHRHIASLDDAIQLLMQAAFSPEEAPGLRRFLVWQGESDLWRNPDDAVLHSVARMLLDRRLMLMRRQRMVRRSGSATPAPGGAAVPFTPSMLRQPSAAGPSAESAPALDPMQMIDQDAQAAVLRLAADQGVPFCEECAKRQRERALEPAMA